MAKIRRRPSFFRAKYDFQMERGALYRFWRESLWKGVFACEGNHEQDRLYQHKGIEVLLISR